METGIKGRCEIVVDSTNTAKALGSGTLDVFATPAMIALIERTAWTSVQDHLEEGQGTVGISLNVTHDSATPIGMKVWCDTELIRVDRRRLDFKAEVFDERGRIGGGEHSRFIVDDEKFLAKAKSK